MNGEAELHQVQRISRAFDAVRSVSFPQFRTWETIPDEWVEQHPYAFESVDSEAVLYLLPRFMRYVLGTFRKEPQSTVYINLLFALREYGKCKNRELTRVNVRYRMTQSQVAAVLGFLKHLRYNQPANVDEEELDRIIRSWRRQTC